MSVSALSLKMLMYFLLVDVLRTEFVARQPHRSDFRARRQGHREERGRWYRNGHGRRFFARREKISGIRGERSNLVRRVRGEENNDTTQRWTRNSFYAAQSSTLRCVHHEIGSVLFIFQYFLDPRAIRHRPRRTSSGNRYRSPCWPTWCRK